MVIRTVPTRDIFDKEKVRTRINARLEVAKAKWIVVAVYGSQGGDLTLHVSDNAVATDALRKPFQEAVEKGLNDAGYFGFELSADAEKVKLFVVGVSLGKDWTPEQWTDAKYAQLWEELRASNPKIDIPFMPSFCGTLSNLSRSGRNRAGLIVTALRNPAAIEMLRAGFLYLHGRTHIVKEFIDRYHSQVCERCLRQGHNATVCRDQAKCRFCGGSHISANHTCHVQYCTAKSKSCSHTVPECAACGTPGHIQGSKDCRQRSADPQTSRKSSSPTPDRPSTPSPHSEAPAPSRFFQTVITPTSTEAAALGLPATPPKAPDLELPDAPPMTPTKVRRTLSVGSPAPAGLGLDAFRTTEEREKAALRTKISQSLRQKEGNWNVMGDDPDIVPSSLDRNPPPPKLPPLAQSGIDWSKVETIPPFSVGLPDVPVESDPPCSQVEGAPEGDNICLFHGNVTGLGTISLAQCKLPVGGTTTH